VTNRFLQYTGGLYISTVTLGELYTWALRAAAPPRRVDVVRELLNDVRVLEVTPQVAEMFGPWPSTRTPRDAR
jgi:predicted nucleic acid-binding protein